MKVAVQVNSDNDSARTTTILAGAARSLNRPTIQFLSKRPRLNKHKGVPHVDDCIPCKRDVNNSRLIDR